MKLLSTQSIVKRLYMPCIIAISVIFPLVLPASVAAAADGTISLGTPSPSSVVGQTNFTVKVSANTGSTAGVSAVGARITFDATKVQYVSDDAVNAEKLTATPDDGVGSGYFQFSRYTTTPMSAGHAFTAVTLTFKALTSSGSLPIGLDRSNSYLQYASGPSSTADALGSVSGTMVSFQAAPAPATCPAGQTGTPPNCTTSSKTTTSTTNNTTTPTKTNTSATPTKSTTTAAPTTSAPTPTTTPTTGATTPEGQPIPASQVAKKSNTKLYAIAGGTLGVVVLAAAAFMLMRRGSLVGASSHVILNTPPAAPVSTAPINKIPAAETQAPGEVVTPNDPNSPPNGPSL